MKSKNTVKELMAAPEVRMAMEKAERETTTATEEDEEEVVLLVPKVVKIVPKLLEIKKNLKANVVVVEVVVAIENVVVVIKVKTKSRLLLQAVKRDHRDLEEVAEAEVVEVTNNPEPKVKEKTLMARTESKTKISLNLKLFQEKIHNNSVVDRLHADHEEMVSKDTRLFVMATIKDHPIHEVRAKETSLLETITSPTNEDKTTRDILPDNQEEEVTTTNRTTGNQDKIVLIDPEVSIEVVKTEAIAAIVAIKTTVPRVVTVVAASTDQEAETRLPENEFKHELFQPTI